MAPMGRQVEEVFHVSEDSQQVESAVLAATSGVPKYFVSSLGVGAVELTRRFTPTVTLVLGLAIGPLWPVMFLYRETETLTFRITREGRGTRLHVSGHADEEMRSRLRQLTGGGLWLHTQPDEFRVFVGGAPTALSR
jgi:hypothetical protein